MEPNLKTPFVIVVEGIIGAGKSTIINHVLVPMLTQKGYRVKVINEPVDTWSDILPLFYADQSRYGYHFQTRAFHSRIIEAQKQWVDHEQVDIYISDRSILSDTIFMRTLYERHTVTQMEYDDYLSLWKMWQQLLPFKPDLVVYLDPNIKVVMDRLRLRARDGEQHVSVDYQLHLKRNHDLLFGDQYVKSALIHYNLPILKLTTDDDFKTNADTQINIVNRIEQQMFNIINKL